MPKLSIFALRMPENGHLKISVYQAFSGAERRNAGFLNYDYICNNFKTGCLSQSHFFDFPYVKVKFQKTARKPHKFVISQH